MVREVLNVASAQIESQYYDHLGIHAGDLAYFRLIRAPFCLLH